MFKRQNSIEPTSSSEVFPARLTVQQTARLLGFAEHDIRILTGARLLNPLGSPAKNAPKYFATVEIHALAANREWLSKASKEVSKYWKDRNAGASARTSSRRPK